MHVIASFVLVGRNIVLKPKQYFCAFLHVFLNYFSTQYQQNLEQQSLLFTIYIYICIYIYNIYWLSRSIFVMFQYQTHCYNLGCWSLAIFADVRSNNRCWKQAKRCNCTMTHTRGKCAVTQSTAHCVQLYMQRTMSRSSREKLFEVRIIV